MLRRACQAALILQLAMPALAFAQEHQPLSVELNGGDMVDGRCRLTFVIENKNKDAIDSLRLDLFVFNQEGRVYRRMVTEMGPVLGRKTIVKLYALDGQCSEIKSILVNDVTACAPAKPDACLDNLELSSRMTNVRFYK